MADLCFFRNTIVGNDGTFITYKSWTHVLSGIPLFLIIHDSNFDSSLWDNFAARIALLTKASVLEVERLEQTTQDTDSEKPLLTKAFESILEWEMVHKENQPIIIAFGPSIKLVEELKLEYLSVTQIILIDYNGWMIADEIIKNLKFNDYASYKNSFEEPTPITELYPRMMLKNFVSSDQKDVIFIRLYKDLITTLTTDFDSLAETVSRIITNQAK